MSLKSLKISKKNNQVGLIWKIEILELQFNSGKMNS